MGKIRLPARVMLVVGVLAASEAEFVEVRPALSRKFGPEELALPPFPFSWTNYYREELGEEPVRAFLAFETLIDRETVPAIKLWTNALEEEIAARNGTPGKRPVNLDPGYMTLGQFFLATTKDQRQRVYVRDGIFVEPTLYFEKGRFHPFPWTYRDYQSEAYIKYFENLRRRLAFRHATGVPYNHRKEKRGET